MPEDLAAAMAVIDALPAAPAPPSDGGPAFPVAKLADSPGMSLRDYFATQAPPPDPNLMYQTTAKDLPGLLETLAWTAYAYADAMLRARGQ